MMIIGVVLAAGALGLLALAWAVARAPEGWEDAAGFYRGPRPAPSPDVRRAPAAARTPGARDERVVQDTAA